MAVDDFLASQVGTIRGYLGRSLIRWRDAMIAGRVPGIPGPGFTWDHLFEAMRAQWTDNWDTWIALSEFAGSPVMPTVTIRGAHGALIGRTGQAFVGRQLFGLAAPDFTATPMEDFNGPAANVINNPFTAAPTGDFSGQVLVTMASNAPAAGTYRGMVLVRLPGGAGQEPLAWVVVVAT